MKWPTFLCVLSLWLLTCDASTVSISRDLTNKRIERKVDISSQVVKIVNKITLENGGSGAVKSFLFAVHKDESNRMAFLGAQVGSKNLELSEVKIPEQKEMQFFQIDLKDPLQPGKTVLVDVESVFTHHLQLYPTAIQQGEKQLVRYHGNHYVLSPYQTTSQTTTVTLPTSSVESFSRLKPVTHSDTMLTYGPYENVAPFSVDPMTVHYENNSPFLAVTRLERVIEVSHWGNIAVEETVDVLHTGAKLKGPFSRYDFQREHNSYSAVKSFKTVLPASAKDVYYRDEIGNISTSQLRYQEDSVEVDLRPRFPLFGGWKTHYLIGYNVPSYEYLFNAGDEHALKIRFLDHVFDDIIVDELIVKIILPEGSRNIRLETPYKVDRLADTLHFTYLDTVGRPVVTATKRNMVENHIQDFVLYYQFSTILMLQEPLLIVGAFVLLFIMVMLYVRLDLTICRDDCSESKMRASSQCEAVQQHHDKRAVAYERLEEEAAKLKQSKDVTQFQNATKKLWATIREETSAITELSTKMKADNAEYADKVADIQKQEKTLREVLNQQLSNAEKLVSGKMNKQQYMEAETQLGKKKEEALDKIRTLLGGI